MSEIKKAKEEKIIDPHNKYTVDAKKGKESKSENCCPCTKPKNLPETDEDAQFQIKFEDFLQNNVFFKK